MLQACELGGGDAKISRFCLSVNLGMEGTGMDSFFGGVGNGCHVCIHGWTQGCARISGLKLGKCSWNSLFPGRFFLGRLFVPKGGFEAGITWEGISWPCDLWEGAGSGISFPAPRGGGGGRESFTKSRALNSSGDLCLYFGSHPTSTPILILTLPSSSSPSLSPLPWEQLCFS